MLTFVLTFISMCVSCGEADSPPSSLLPPPPSPTQKNESLDLSLLFLLLLLLVRVTF